jgi:hypothetical protein
MLIVASATPPKVGAAGLDPIFRGCDDLNQRSLCEAGFMVQASFDNLTWQRELYEDRLTRAFAFGLMSEPGTAVDRLFNL